MFIFEQAKEHYQIPKIKQVMGS